MGLIFFYGEVLWEVKVIVVIACIKDFRVRSQGRVNLNGQRLFCVINDLMQGKFKVSYRYKGRRNQFRINCQIVGQFDWYIYLCCILLQFKCEVIMEIMKMVRIFLFVQIEKLIQEGMELEYLKLVFVEKYYNIFLLLIFMFFFLEEFFQFFK